MTRFDRVEPRLPDLLTQLAAPGLALVATAVLTSVALAASAIRATR